MLFDYVTDKVATKVFYGESSAKTATFLSDLPKLLGFPIRAIQTDNGSEYMARFHEQAEAMGVTHCFNYVKKPIYNGKVERFNRTLQEHFKYDVDFLDDLAYDLPAAQQLLDNYVHFYNDERPHAAIGFLTPNECVLKFLEQKPAVQKVLN